MWLTSTWSRCKVLLHVCAWLQHEVDVKCLHFNDNTTKILELSVCCSTMTTLQKSLNCRCVALQWQHYNNPWTVGVLLYNDNTTNILELSVCCSTMTTLQTSLNCRCVALQWQHYKHPWTVSVLLYNDNTTNILELSVCCSNME